MRRSWVILALLLASCAEDDDPEQLVVRPAEPPPEVLRHSPVHNPDVAREWEERGYTIPGAEPGAAPPVAASVDALDGSWEATPGQQEEIDRAIERVVEQMSVFTRPFARSQLDEATDPCQRLDVQVSDEEVVIRCDDLPPAVAPPDGRWHRYVDASGDVLRLSFDIRDDQLVQRFDSGGGVRTNTYVPSADGATMNLRTVITSDRLPMPVRYTTTFQRVGQAEPVARG